MRSGGGGLQDADTVHCHQLHLGSGRDGPAGCQGGDKVNGVDSQKTPL